MVQPQQVREAIRRALPDADVEVEDLTGGAITSRCGWCPRLSMGWAG